MDVAGCMDGWTDGRTDGRMDGWMARMTCLNSFFLLVSTTFLNYIILGYMLFMLLLSTNTFLPNYVMWEAVLLSYQKLPCVSTQLLYAFQLIVRILNCNAATMKLHCFDVGIRISLRDKGESYSKKYFGLALLVKDSK